ncbi:hypothetical protein ACFWSF_11210 [Streptomyces sp. NPDC058611]|uniref:hypothetical protein n=1 Tax=unclassified Streptomyces TaxID=2593676 RepID=UPI00364CAF2F
MSRRWRWVVAGWAALALAGGAFTLYLNEPAGSATPPARWERGSTRETELVTCPSPGNADHARVSCSYWERG